MLGMRMFNMFVIVFYTLLFLLVGAFLIVFSLHLVPLEEISSVLEYVYQVPNLRLIVGSIGALLVVFSISTAQLMVGRMQRERTIAFSNPEGQVTVSLAAIEDFVRRLAHQIPELKELKPTVLAGKKGVEISGRATLWSDTNIPEAAAKVQTLIKSRIADMLGIEEAIKVSIHIGKIVHREESAPIKRATALEQSEPEMPFRGYGKEWGEGL